ncbi:MAG TPA: 6,7-dimethyl-8-ribityllumazine synthase, partial [Candidatus Dormibacteraeota bacterium]|nr:6,7-dimethyl-8-ribityllumazine synthase [Candidatus Dormibacteraeota bacterium]
MLQPVQPRKFSAASGRFAIIASEYNGRYVNAMLRSAQRELKRAGAKDVAVYRVPGAYEIPVIVSRLAGISSGTSEITHP